MAKLVAQEIQQLLGCKVREIMRHFKLANAGRKSVAKIARANNFRIYNALFCFPCAGIEIEHVEQIKESTNTSHRKSCRNLLDKRRQTVDRRVEKQPAARSLLVEPHGDRKQVLCFALLKKMAKHVTVRSENSATVGLTSWAHCIPVPS